MNRSAPMRRTGFKRARPQLVTLPVDDDLVVTIERIAPRLYRVPAPSVAPVFEQAMKLNPLRSESYRRFVASHACFECGLAGSSQCAHANFGKGMAMKTSDRDSWPMCFRCHADHDHSRGMTRDQRREKEARYVDRMQEIARAAGRAEIPP
jgi:hypothetical protein